MSTMHARFDNIERELRAAVESATDHGALINRLERLINDVRSVRFAAHFENIAAGMAAAREPEPALEGVEPPPSRFKHGDKVRTPDGYLAYYGYKVGESAVVNVVFQATEYKETDLIPSPL
jgi:hypothetical protein